MLTVQQKYADAVVVGFWQALARQGLQQAESELARRYLPPAGSLLDAGCGAGRAVLALSARGYPVTGIDLSLPMLHAGRELAADMRLGGANLLALPFADGHFAAALVFFGALQHLPGRHNRRQALAELARAVQPGGRLLLGLDNLAPALTCYGYWLGQRITNYQLSIINYQLRITNHELNSPNSPNPPNSPPADSTLWQRRGHPLLWHGRGLLRSLRWRSWPGLVDRVRRLAGQPDRVGDVNVAQFSQPATPGKVYYHLYRPGELAADAAAAGWTLLGWHAGSELTGPKKYPESIRALDKQLFFAFQKMD